MLSELMDIRSIAGEKFMNPDQVVFHYEKVKNKGLTCRNPLHRYCKRDIASWKKCRMRSQSGAILVASGRQAFPCHA